MSDLEYSSIETKLIAALEPPVAAMGFEIESLQISSIAKERIIRIVIDRDGGVSLDNVAEVSQRCSEILDTTESVANLDSYLLEVTSPGADRPLTLPKHWKRNIGRLVRFTFQNEESLIGRIIAVSDGEVELSLEADREKLKGRKTAQGPLKKYKFAEISKARIEIEFNRESQHGH